MGGVAEIIGRQSLSKHVKKITWCELVNTLKTTQAFWQIGGPSQVNLEEALLLDGSF
jgi:hypothetical protein